MRRTLDVRLADCSLRRQCSSGSENNQPRAKYRNRAAVIGIASTSLALGLMVPVASASTTSIQWVKKNVEFSTYTAHGVSGYVERGTTYMPVWYIMQALRRSGYAVSFNGKTLSITTPSDITPNIGNISIGTGNLSIRINGKVAKFVQSEVHPDPATHVNTQFIPIYYIQQVLSALSFYNRWDGTNWTGRPIDAAIQGTQDIEQRQMVAFGLQLLNADGTYFVPSGNVSWSETGTGHANIDKTTGIFSAPSPGTYEITAKVDGFQWTKTVTVYGQAVGVALSASKTSLVADGQDTSTITVNAVDAQGNVDPNFTGEVQLSVPSNAGSFTGGTTSGSYNQTTVYLYNGTGTVTLTAPTTPPESSAAIIPSDLASVSQAIPTAPTYKSITLSYSAPVLSQIGIRPSTTMLDSSNQNPVNVSLSLVDAAGYPVTNSSYGGVTVTISVQGPGSFVPGASIKTTTAYIYPGVTPPPIPIYPIAGQTGDLTVTASTDGITGTTTLTSSSSQPNSTLSISGVQGTLKEPFSTGTQTIPVGTSFTLYTVTTLDSNGNPLPQSDILQLSDSSTPTDATNQTSTVDGLSYFSVRGDQPYQPLPIIGQNIYSLSTSALTGKAQFIVFSKGNVSPATTIRVEDVTRNSSVTTTLGAN